MTIQLSPTQQEILSHAAEHYSGKQAQMIAMPKRPEASGHTVLRELSMQRAAKAALCRFWF